MDSGMPVELLLKYLKEYKVMFDFNRKDLGDVHRDTPMLSDRLLRFGPNSPTNPEKPLNEKNSEEYENYKETRFNPHPSAPGLHVETSIFWTTGRRGT